MLPACWAWLTLTCSSDRALGVQRGLPQLVGIHFAEALVALDAEALAAELEDRVDQPDRARDAEFALARRERRGPGVDRLQSRRHLVQPAGVARPHQRAVDRMALGHPAQRADKGEAALIDDFRVPAPLGLRGKPVEALGNRVGDRLRLAVLQQRRVEGAEDRGLLGDVDVGEPLHHRRHQAARGERLLPRAPANPRPRPVRPRATRARNPATRPRPGRRRARRRP